MAGKLGERLPAQARSAGAEENDIAGGGGEAPGGGRYLVEVVAFFRQAQQRQRAVGMPSAQPAQRKRPLMTPRCALSPSKMDAYPS